MNKILENYSIDTLIDNAYDMCDENPSIAELQEAIAQDIIGSPDVSFNDADIYEVLDMTYKIIKKSEEGDTPMKLTTTFVEEQTDAAIEAIVGTLHETVIDSVYALMEIKGIDIHNLTQEDEELIDRTVIEMVDNLL